MVSDGFNLTIMPLVMPTVAKEWGLDGTGSFGTIFSAGVVGIMIGAPLFGSVADRLGRKKTFIFSLLFFGVSSLGAIYVSTVPQLIALRFVTGLGLGGALPLAIVISSELTPAAWRGRTISIVTTGVTIGASLSGFAASWLIPAAGWRSNFLLAGAVPIAIGLFAIRILPETAVHLQKGVNATHSRPQSMANGADTDASFAKLFRGPFAYMTPVLWMLFTVIGLVNYFIFSWGPTLFQDAGFDVADVALGMGLFGGFGAIGGLLIGWPVDRFGMKPVTLIFLLAIPAIASLALLDVGREFFLAKMAIIGLLVFPLQVAINGVATMIYPPAIRAKGVGWGLGTVRLGQILGASGGGMLIGMGASMSTLFWLLSGLVLIGAVGCSLLSRWMAMTEQSQ